MEEALSRIVFDLETHQTTNNSDSPTPISESTLLDLQTLFHNIINTDDTEDAERFWEELASKNISPASLLRILTISMDSGPSHLTLLASQVYLSILLSPNSPVFTLFTPIAFLSLLCSLRRSFKHHKSNQPPQEGESSSGGAHKPNKKRKPGGRARASRNRIDDDEDNDGNRFDIRVLFPVLERLESVLGLIHLNRFPDSLKSLVQTIAEIPITALEFYENSTTYHRLSDLCFRILSGVLKPVHGDQTTTALEVLKALSPAILLLKSQARTSALKFVTNQMMVMAKSSDAVRKAIVYLPRYLVNKAPERSEPRASAVESIMEIVRAMEFEDQLGFVDYVVKMTQGKAHLRLLAVDLIPILLMSMPDPLGLNAEDGSEDWWGLRCLDGMIQRCSDSAAGIRARALSNLAQVVGFLSSDVECLARLKEMLGFENVRDQNLVGGLNEILKKRCLDEKAAVRKAALLLVSKSTALLGGAVDEVVLKTMGIACSDPLVSIRKAAISALSEVFRKCSDERVVTEWLHSVPRLITDNESSIQEECENLFLELVLDRLSKVGSQSSHSRSHCSGLGVKKKSFEAEIESVFPESVLILLKGLCDGEVTPCLKKICTSLGKKKQLKPTLAIALQNIIKTSESLWLSHLRPIEKWTAPPGAWFLLSEVSAFLPKSVGWEFLHNHWQLLDKIGVDEVRSPVMEGDVVEEVEGSEPNSADWARDRVFLLQTISNVAVELPPEPAADLAHNLLKRIEEFNMHPTEVNAHVKALRTLCKRKALNPAEGDNLVLKWVQQLLSKALRILENYISVASEASKAGSFLTPPRNSSRKGRRESKMSSLSQAVAAVYTIGSLIMVSPAADLKGIIPVLHSIITSGSSEPKMKKLPGPTVSIKQMALSLYIQSWLTMGKICLADGKLAKRYIPLFVQELEKNDCAALRNNIVVVMTDFCVRYTALVDCYIPKITNCLRDPCEVVRRQTFILLSRLLQRDYVKWRGVLFLRFLLCLVDESEKIRQLSDFLFGNILKAKAPLLAYNSFVEAIFVLNDCHAHAGHSGSQVSGTESRLFSIRGNDENSRSQRMHVYVSLLKQMAPEQHLATSAKLYTEILAAASDGLLNLDDVTAQSVLQDALQILARKEIRIQSNRGAAAETEMDEEGGDGGGADAAAAARRKVVAQVAKKSLIQNAIPIFIELKRLLESRKSPLTGCLMECLRVLLKDYKNEIDDILVADKQLQKELIYDMEKYEAVKTKSTIVEAVATMQKSNSFCSPPGHRPSASKLPREADVNSKLATKLRSPEIVASVMAEVAAEATVKSVLREVNRGTSTPQLNSISMPKLKSCMGGAVSRDCPRHVLESLRRRQTFDSGDEN
ncbi:Condensin subunit 1/Condensin-2 complex subunit D3 [Macleaya cordata]|uniref:Condensin subunit 1/Condensin-2 complex subunit D3 n=1 Tax=Macleaya cordata TaxID=56857 RepID=A0A200PPW6_MACCD|nr:Condensin subunit 1/Condensin-2 complex subunit D3 [Macleaya cordata]